MADSSMPQVVQALRALGTEMDRLDDVACRLYGLNRSDMRPLEIVSGAAPSDPLIWPGRWGSLPRG